MIRHNKGTTSANLLAVSEPALLSMDVRVCVMFLHTYSRCTYWSIYESREAAKRVSTQGSVNGAFKKKPILGQNKNKKLYIAIFSFQAQLQ